MNTVRLVAALLVAMACAAGPQLVDPAAPEVTTLQEPPVDSFENPESVLTAPGSEGSHTATANPVPAAKTGSGVSHRASDRRSSTSISAAAPERTPCPEAAATRPTTSPAPSTTDAQSSLSAPQQTGPLGAAAPTCGPAGTAGVLPIAAPQCTVNATKASQANAAKPGDTICFKGNTLAGTRLNVTASGTASSPITITGEGNTPVKGIRVNSSNVVVQGFNVIGAAAPGVQLKGNNLTLQSTRIDHPTGGDYDGIRFFGDNIKILHNHILNITNTRGAHADCMQTYATTTPTSHNVVISGNRCEKIDNQCLIAQGPHSRAGDGSGRGESSGLTFTNNYCDAHASQAVHVDDFQNVTMMNNDIQGRVRKAFNFINNSTGADVSCNKLGPGVGTEVIIDRSSRPGYQGP